VYFDFIPRIIANNVGPAGRVALARITRAVWRVSCQRIVSLHARLSSCRVVRGQIVSKQEVAT
jgi:hypothetical protein